MQHNAEVAYRTSTTSGTSSDENLVALIRARVRKGDTEIIYPVVEVAHFRQSKMTERWAFMDAVPEDVAAFFAN